MSKRKYHFITGLPRSGSTLLAAILQQNPDFYAGMTSPVGSLTYALRNVMSQNIEVSTRTTDQQRGAILRGVFDNYYDGMPESVVFDTNRGWSARIPELTTIFPNAKLIATVRSPAWIIDSFERVMRENPLRHSRIAAGAGSNVAIRSKAMMSADGVVGSALGNLLEALSGPDQHRLLIVEYDALCLNPKETLRSIYRFLHEPEFEHDFNSVEYRQDDFDDALQTPGLHTVTGAVEVKPRETLLPFDIFQSLSSQAFWRQDFSTKAPHMIGVSSDGAEVNSSFSVN